MDEHGGTDDREGRQAPRRTSEEQSRKRRLEAEDERAREIIERQLWPTSDDDG
ncbi:MULTISPECIES: hypothetical protein [Micromonospora]|uniref:hypothetical protein n=1 Tax=Micromonospora TaxID=1873 RepID=UPI001585DA85|nr:hypothetical protein [Micromonospora yangpuensis]GGM13382.1 hypothetical protein GCM10012279_34440 [Micromonospora yangpuensis]